MGAIHIWQNLKLRNFQTKQQKICLFFFLQKMKEWIQPYKHTEKMRKRDALKSGLFPLNRMLVVDIPKLFKLPPSLQLVCVCYFGQFTKYRDCQPPLHSSIPTDVMLSSTSPLLLSFFSLSLSLSLSLTLPVHHLTWPLNRSLYSLTLVNTHTHSLL